MTTNVSAQKVVYDLKDLFIFHSFILNKIYSILLLINQINL